MALHARASTRVMVVDDHQTFAELLSAALDRETDLVSVGHATTAAQALERTRSLRPDLVLMDVQLPDSDGFQATSWIKSELPSTRVVMLTAHAHPDYMARAERAGASAFLAKDGSLKWLMQVVREVTLHGFRCDGPPRDAGDPAPVVRPVPPHAPHLTQRERDVLTLLSGGWDVRGISRRLMISEVTCRGYVKTLLVKLDAHTQLQAVVTAGRLGLLPGR